MSLVKLAGPIRVALKDLGKAIKKSFTPKNVKVKDIINKATAKATAKATTEHNIAALAGQKAQAKYYNKKLRNAKIGIGSASLIGLGAGASGTTLYNKNKKK